MVDVPTPPFGSAVSADLLRQRMLDRMASDLDKAEGSLAYSLIAPFAVELDALYDQLDLAVELGFAQDSYGGFLEARAEEHGVFRLPASVASGDVTFTGVNGTVIPAGTLVGTVGTAGSPSVTFSTSAGVTIAGGTATVGVVAVEPGADGNVPSGAISQMVTFVSGVSSVTNADPFSGGADEETDELLRARLLAAVSAGRGAGTIGDYETWALEVAGVGDATAQALWNGAGTVRVLVLDVDGDPAAAPLVSDVADYIATLSPIGADVTVAAPTGISVDVDVTLTVESGNTVGSVTPGVEEAISGYFDSLDPGDDVILTEVGAVIVQAPGVADYSGLQLNAVASNQAIAADEIAQEGVVTIS